MKKVNKFHTHPNKYVKFGWAISKIMSTLSWKCQEKKFDTIFEFDMN